MSEGGGFRFSMGDIEWRLTGWPSHVASAWCFACIVGGTVAVPLVVALLVASLI